MMQYRDFFQHIENRAKQKEEKRAQKEKIRRISEQLAERLDISPVKVLQELSDRPREVLKEWVRAEKQGKKDTGDSIERLKDSANAPSVGDEVKVKFNEEARGYLTPQQESMNGAKGTVTIRDSLQTSSQRARYSVEVHESETEDGMPYTIHNLTPGEVVPLDSNEKS